LLPRWVFRGGGDGAGLAGEAAGRQGAAGEGRAGSRRRAAAARLRRLAPLLGCLRLRARGAAQEALGRRGVHRRRSLRGGRGGVRPVRREMGVGRRLPAVRVPGLPLPGRRVPLLRERPPRLLLHQVAVAAGAPRSPEVGSSSCLLHWRLPQPPIPIPFPSLDWDGSEVCYCVKHGPLRLPGEEERPVRLKESEHLASNSLPQCLLNNVKFRSSPLSFIGSCSGIWIDDGAIKNYEPRSVFDSRGGRRATLLGTRSTIGNSMILACH
jgi:hypothetical protein